MIRSCRQCSAEFPVGDDDLAFYDRVSPVVGNEKLPVPPPTLCPPCRQQRRLAWRNEQYLYRRACDHCGKSIVAVHHPNSTFPVFCVACWWSDGWDPLQFGRPYDPARPFFDQLAELQGRVPQIAIQNDNGISSENSEYCYDISRAKNCYRLVGSWYAEECHYSLNVNRSKFVVDCNTVSIDCELVYECLDSQRLYRCAYLQNCEGCSDCFFGFDLKGCRDCVGCFGLRQKRFCFFNEQLGEAEFRERMSRIELGSFAQIRMLRERFESFALDTPRRAANLQNCEDSIGNNLFNCKNVVGYSCFNAEYSKFIDRSDGPKCSYDLINTGSPQWCYDCVTPDDSYLVLFSVWCWKSKNILYSDNCHSSEHLCGCISLRRRRYAILNTEYPPEEYERLLRGIVLSLADSGGWGEHLPIALSPFGYNESAANEYYPLSSQEVRARGWPWREQLPDLRGKETIGWEGVPDAVADVGADFERHVLACTDCGKNYKLIPSELDFYRRLPAPVPRQCPHCRHLARFRRKTPTMTWCRSCSQCGREVVSTYAPERREVILCDPCYFALVY